MNYNVLMWKADLAGCGWARIEMIAKYLNKYCSGDIKATSSMVMDPASWVVTDNKGQVVKRNYDLTVHQRQYGDNNLRNFNFLKNTLKIPCIYEIDDYLHGVSKESTAYFAYNPNRNPERFANIEAYLRQADLVTVTTEYLKKLYSLYSKNIVVLPNCIDFEDVFTEEATKKTDHGDEIWLGWAGSNTHLPDIKLINDVIKQILDDYPNVKLALGGWDGKMRDKEGKFVLENLYPWKDIPDSRIVNIPWAKEMKDYPKMIAQFDIGIAPLEDTDFNRAKSNIKFLEYASCGVAVVASDVEPYTATIINGETGYLCKTRGALFADWYKKLKKLIESKELRLTMGANAKKYVKENFDIKNNIYKWKDCYTELIEKFRKENNL